MLKAIPGWWRPNYSLAVALDQRGQIDEAIAYYQKAVDADPKFVMGSAGASPRLWEARTNRRSRRQYQKALEMDPHSAPPTGGLAELLDAADGSTRPLPIIRRL